MTTKVLLPATTQAIGITRSGVAERQVEAMSQPSTPDGEVFDGKKVEEDEGRPPAVGGIRDNGGCRYRVDPHLTRKPDRIYPVLNRIAARVKRHFSLEVET